MNRVLLSAVALGLCICCGSDEPRTPVSPSAGMPVDNVVSIEITGATRLTSIAEVSRLAAMARFVSGATRDVSAESSWRSADPSVAAVTASGALTAIAPGRTAVFVQYQRLSVSHAVTVLPTGTFVITGHVFEPGNVAVFGARVEVVGGAQAGRAAMADFNGAYELYGIGGDVTLRATKSEYMPGTVSASVSADRVVDFELAPNVAPIMLAGTYRATFSSGSTCAANLPEDLRSRTFTATVRQSAARVDVEFSGAEFAVNPRDGRGKGFSAVLHGSSLQFTIGDTYYGYFEDLVEQVGPSTFLSVNGFTTATATTSETSGILKGTIAVWDAPNGFYAPGKRLASRCAGDHPFSFARQ